MRMMTTTSTRNVRPPKDANPISTDDGDDVDCDSVSPVKNKEYHFHISHYRNNKMKKKFLIQALKLCKFKCMVTASL